MKCSHSWPLIAGGLQIELRNLFGGKYPALAKTTNDFLNLNSGRIIEEIKPQIKFEVTRLFQTVMAQAFSKLPIEQFLEQIQQAPRSNRSLKSLAGMVFVHSQSAGQWMVVTRDLENP